MASPHFPEVSSTIVQSEMPQLLEAEHVVVPSPSTAESTPVGSPTDVSTSLPDDGGQSSMSFAQVSYHLCA